MIGILEKLILIVLLGIATTHSSTRVGTDKCRRSTTAGIREPHSIDKNIINELNII